MIEASALIATWLLLIAWQESQSRGRVMGLVPLAERCFTTCRGGSEK